MPVAASRAVKLGATVETVSKPYVRRGFETVSVFRALAENLERAQKVPRPLETPHAERLDARRVQQRPRRACSPTSVFGLKMETAPSLVF